MTFTNSTIKASYSVKAKRGIDRKSSIGRSYTFGQSSEIIKAIITIRVTSLYLPISKENQLKTQMGITYLLGQ